MRSPLWNDRVRRLREFLHTSVAVVAESQGDLSPLANLAIGVISSIALILMVYLQYQ